MKKRRVRRTKIFLAIKLPDRLKKELAKVQRDLDQKAPGILKFVKPDLLHISIVFLGSISDGNVSRAVRIIRAIAETQKPFFLRLTKLGAFPRPARPAVIWVGLDDPDHLLLELMKRAAARLAANEIPSIQGAGRPAPHITLARVNRKRRGTHFGTLKSVLESTEILLGDIKIPVRELVLYQSHHGRPGPEYLPITVFPLTKSSSSAAARRGSLSPDAL